MALDGIEELIRKRIEGLRPKLLDLSRRNPLISTRFSSRSSSHIRVVDELPDVLAYALGSGRCLRLDPLPPLEEDPRDEDGREFQDALSNALMTDETYLAEMEKIDQGSDAALERGHKAERSLRDRLRVDLGMPARQSGRDLSLVQHARNNGISPGYDLPLPSEEHDDGRHTDEAVQTLLLPQDLERKMNALLTKCRTWMQETGINVFNVSFGFLEWSDGTSASRIFRR